MLAVVWAFFNSTIGRYILAAIGIGMVLGWAYHHVWHNGYEDGIAKYAPVMAACADSLDAHSVKTCADAIKQSASDLATEKANNAALTSTVGRQNDGVAKLESAKKAAQAAAAAANKEADDNAVFYTERLKGLKQNLAHPSKDPSADTDKILRALAIDQRKEKR